MKYFIGNWKMFGVPKSINIPKKINFFHLKDKNRNKYKIIITYKKILFFKIMNTSFI